MTKKIIAVIFDAITVAYKVAVIVYVVTQLFG